MKRIIGIICSAVLAMSLLTGCSGNPLPEGMDEDALIVAGRGVITQLNDGDFEDISASFREDERETISADDIKTMMVDGIGDAGAYEKEGKSLATGDVNEATDEHYGIAVIIVDHEEDAILYRIAFDAEMTLIGMSVGEA